MRSLGVPLADQLALQGMVGILSEAIRWVLMGIITAIGALIVALLRRLLLQTSRYHKQYRTLLERHIEASRVKDANVGRAIADLRVRVARIEGWQRGLASGARAARDPLE